MGFGDEGKGLTTSYLVSLNPKQTLVGRFNGGHQAGHTVVLGDKRHVFSSFGSGTLQDAPTWWSRFCTFYPIAFMNEYKILQSLGHEPTVYVDPLAPVTTPLDITRNHVDADANKFGSVGVGFGATLERHERHFKLYFQDLYNDAVLKAKLKNIASIFYNREIEERDGLANFMLAVSDLRKLKNVKLSTEIDFLDYEHVVLEGAQGVLLDQEFGFFPYVTRSYTTSRKGCELLAERNLPKPDIYYVTRSYQTRHGAGPMTNEDWPVVLQNNENETNVTHKWQGSFRTSHLDADLLSYAVQCDSMYSAGLRKNLVITCLDQHGDLIGISDKGERLITTPLHLPDYLKASDPIRNIFVSHSPDGTKIHKL